MPSSAPVAIVTHWDVTGGPEIVLALAENGFQVVANTNEEQLLMAGAGQNVLAVEFDPELEQSVKQKIGTVAQMFGRVDVLVNNPNAWNDAALGEITEAMWAEVISHNLKGTFYCSRVVAPLMLEAGSGCIINVTSTAGLTGAHTPFAVSCAGIMSLTRSLATELSPHVRVNCIATGLMDEPWVEEAGPDFRRSLVSKIPLGRLCKPVDLAEMVVFLATGAGFLTSQIITLDGGEVRR